MGGCNLCKASVERGLRLECSVRLRRRGDRRGPNPLRNGPLRKKHSLMAKSLSLTSPEMVNRLSAAVLRARRLVVGNFTGIHASPHKGASVEFIEHKRYSPGDEIKHVDWKLLARSDRYYVKQFENETNLRATLVLDASASMAYGPTAPAKFDCARQVAAGLAYLLLGQSDAVGLLSQQGERRLHVPPRSGMAHYRALACALDELEAAGGPAWVDHLMELAGSAPRRGMFILLSDLLLDTQTALKALRMLGGRGHDVMVLHVLHPWELEFPFRDVTMFTDIEAPQRRLLADPRDCREAYLREIEELCRTFRTEVRGMGMDYLLLRSDCELEQALAHHLAWREAQGGVAV